MIAQESNLQRHKFFTINRVEKAQELRGVALCAFDFLGKGARMHFHSRSFLLGECSVLRYICKAWAAWECEAGGLDPRPPTSKARVEQCRSLKGSEGVCERGGIQWI